ncbi:ovochymase-like [Euwallacea similis]|uniref:ovochymase-like n=1 Tax=Euwallacea similis TaxID=1736056 RepID=UPI00344BAC39
MQMKKCEFLPCFLVLICAQSVRLEGDNCTGYCAGLENSSEGGSDASSSGDLDDGLELSDLNINLKFATPCETPNGEVTFCVNLSQCPVLEAVKNKKRYSEYIQASRCGPKDEGLENFKVCCGKYKNFRNKRRKSEQSIESADDATSPKPIFDSDQLLPRDCGTQRFIMRGRIVGGTEASIGEYPWMARLIHKNKNGRKSYGCAGFLIHPKYVVTAAHCIVSEFAEIRGDPYSVLLGEHNVATVTDCSPGGVVCADSVQISRINQTIVHSAYSKKSKNHHNDIALIYLNKHIKMSDFVKPICLAMQEDPYCRKYYISGWGKTETAETSPVKLKVDLSVFDKEVCREKFKSLLDLDIHESQICAGGEKMKDSCNGDSGGPLMMNNGTHFLAAGLVSYGVGCGMADWPGVYSSIPYHLNWIKLKMLSITIKNPKAKKPRSRDKAKAAKANAIEESDSYAYVCGGLLHELQVANNGNTGLLIQYKTTSFGYLQEITSFNWAASRTLRHKYIEVKRTKMGLLHLRGVYFVICISAVSAQTLGGFCRTPLGEAAKCISVYECNSLMSLLRIPTRTSEQTQFLFNSKCGTSSSGTTYVCCGSGFNKITSTEDNSDSRVVPNKAIPDRNNCGWQAANRIFNGEATALDEFPWMAVIQYLKPNGQRRIACAGSLISRRYILTAAHCVKGEVLVKLGQPINVRLGEYDTSSPGKDCFQVNRTNFCNQNEINAGIEEIIPHPGYTGEYNRYDDIALIRLNQDIPYSDYIQPVCLPNLSEASTAGEKLIVAGWGRTEKGRDSNVKLKLQVPLTEASRCRNAFVQLGVQLGDDQICAGGEDGKDSCTGDSGGPLMRTLPSDGTRWMIEGVVSFGYTQCGTKGFPGVYTRVAKYVPWIHKTVKN